MRVHVLVVCGLEWCVSVCVGGGGCLVQPQAERERKGCVGQRCLVVVLGVFVGVVVGWCVVGVGVV